MVDGIWRTQQYTFFDFSQTISNFELRMQKGTENAAQMSELEEFAQIIVEVRSINAHICNIYFS